MIAEQYMRRALGTWSYQRATRGQLTYGRYEDTWPSPHAHTGTKVPVVCVTFPNGLTFPSWAAHRPISLRSARRARWLNRAGSST
eukprot:2639810-Prymnesium_polylepis.1